MRTITAILAAATLMLGVATAAGTANVLSVDRSDFAAIWNEAVSQRLQFIAGEITVECDVTMSGSFHSQTLAKTRDLDIGDVTSMTIEECSEGTVLALGATLPWDVTYQTFSGTLPAIDLVRLAIVDAQLRVEINAFADCLAVADRSDPIAGNILVDTRTGVVDALDALEDTSISLDDIPGGESFLCDEYATGTANGLADLADDAEGSGDVTLTLYEDPAVLRASPTSVTIEDLARDGTFTITNTDADATAMEVEIEDVAADRETPEFDTTGAGCLTRIAPGESCTYTVAANARPEPSGRVVVHYRDGTRAEAERTTTIEVDIES